MRPSSGDSPVIDESPIGADTNGSGQLRWGRPVEGSGRLT